MFPRLVFDRTTSNRTSIRTKWIKSRSYSITSFFCIVGIIVFPFMFVDLIHLFHSLVHYREVLMF
ncbi:DUF2985 domain-containing protein [Bacillus sp. HNG]|nr:DUF2985 domain-containing protein [Bacillus sp. HNG]